MKALLREPLLHFLLLGAGLFLVYGYLNRDRVAGDPQTIVVDREALLTFLQYRSRAFDAARFDEAIDALPEQDMQWMIGEYVREEVLYREAKALRLDSNDYVARLRLIQQLEFITRGFTDARLHLTAQQIEDYYLAHKSAYRIEPAITFTHVFFSEQRHGADRALALARRELRTLNESAVGFDEASSHGEHYIYELNYVEQEPEDVASHFGVQMQTQLFALAPDEHRWRGPFQSPYGAHLVLITHRREGHLAPLAEVRTRVEQEARQAALDAGLEASIQSLVRTYKVKVNLRRGDGLAAS
jgi:hypothetical protein